MTSIHARMAITVSMLSLLLFAARPSAGSAPEVLSDSTTVESWTLANGLKVVTRHVPRARAIAVVMSYRLGTAQDLEGHEGQSALLAELQYRAGAKDTPERSREELVILRPLGWNLKVTPYLTHLAEIASTAQFPGVLHQVAGRAAGVTLTEAVFQSALQTVRRDLAENYGSSAERTLYYDVRALAAGANAASLSRYASGKGLDGLTLKDAQQKVSAIFTPKNAVLAVAGNLTGYDLHRLIEHEFGAIPAGGPALPLASSLLKAGQFRLPGSNLQATVGALGILGPALTDTLHPSFAIHAMLLGSFCRQRWGPATPPLTTRFDFSLLDDPEVVRLYPPISPDPNDKTPVVEEFHYTLAEVPVQLERDSYTDALDNVTWLLGGPMPDPVVLRMRREPGALYTLASGMGAREQWGDASFWSQYRRRFDAAAGRDLPNWRVYFGTLEHIVQLRLVPESAAAR